MKRVSRAYAVLSDADRRLRYDAELKRTGEFPPEPPAPERKSIPVRALITFGWLICAFAGVLGIGWYVGQQSGLQLDAPSAVRAASAELTRSVAAAQKPAEENMIVDAVAMKAERERAIERATFLEEQIEFLTNRLLTASPAPLSGCARFNGLWVLADASTSALSTGPQSADLILAEDQSHIQGRYRARYSAAGRPDASIVRFYFDGWCEQESLANLKWTGDTGTKGELQMRLASDNSIDLVWSATETDDQTGPVSGTATLIRKR